MIALSGFVDIVVSVLDLVLFSSSLLYFVELAPASSPLRQRQ